MTEVAISCVQFGAAKPGDGPAARVIDGGFGPVGVPWFLVEVDVHDARSADEVLVRCSHKEPVALVNLKKKLSLA